MRRSRHAETWLAKLDDREIFIKIIHPAAGFARLKRIFRKASSAHVAGITTELVREGFAAPQPLVWGRQPSTGRELILTERARALHLPRFVRENGAELRKKRAMLRALGAEIARLHNLDFIHGDLTPFNVMVSKDHPGRFIFLDHERTRKTWLARFQRPRLRNLVQLGHSALPNLTRTDRMRVWNEYAGKAGSRGELKRLIAMIRRRVERDARRSEPDNNRIVARGRVRET